MSPASYGPQPGAIIGCRHCGPAPSSPEDERGRAMPRGVRDYRRTDGGCSPTVARCGGSRAREVGGAGCESAGDVRRSASSPAERLKASSALARQRSAGSSRSWRACGGRATMRPVRIASAGTTVSVCRGYRSLTTLAIALAGPAIASSRSRSRAVAATVTDDARWSLQLLA